MRFNSLGNAVHGTVAIFIDGVAEVSTPAIGTGGGWGWLSDTVIAGQSDQGSGFKLNQVNLSTDVLTNIDAHGANLSACGNGVIGAFLTGGAAVGVRFPLSGFGPFPLAALGDVSPDGVSALVQNYQAGTGIVTFSAAGTALSNKSITLAGGYLIRAKDGVYAYRDAQGTHLRSLSNGSLQTFAPRTETVFQTVPILINGAMWVVEVTDQLTLRPATSSNGFVITTDDTFNVDAVEISSGIVRIGWGANAGEGATALRMADVNVGTGGFSLGTTASGSLVFTTQPNLTQSAIPVGPIEGGSLTATKQPRYAIKSEAFVGGEDGKRVYQKYWDLIGARAFGPPDLTQAQGMIQPDQGGTGATTGLAVLDGSNVVQNTTQLDTAQTFGPLVLADGRTLVVGGPVSVSTYLILNGSANLVVV